MPARITIRVTSSALIHLLCAAMSSSRYGKAEPYSPPEWARELKVVPKTRIPVS